MATQKNNAEKSSVSLGFGVFIILSVVIGFIVIGYFEVNQDNPENAIMDSPENVIINELSDEFSEIEATIDTLFEVNPEKLLSIYSRYGDKHYRKYGSKINEKIFETLITESSNTNLVNILINKDMKKHMVTYNNKYNTSDSDIPKRLKTDILSWASGDDAYKNSSETKVILTNIRLFFPPLYDSVSKTFDSLKKKARSKFSSIEKSYYAHGNMPIEISDLSGIERNIYDSEFRDNLDNVYFRPTKLSTIKKFRGKYNYTTNFNLVSDTYHYLSDYSYYDYPEDEFGANKLRNFHGNLRANDKGRQRLVSSYYLLSSPKSTDILSISPDKFIGKYNFQFGYYPFVNDELKKGLITRGKDLIIIEDKYESGFYHNHNFVQIQFENIPDALFIKPRNDSNAERFKKTPKTFRINFESTIIRYINNLPPNYTVKENPFASMNRNYANVYHYFVMQGKITSIELYSDVLGTLVWIPDDAIRNQE